MIVFLTICYVVALAVLVWLKILPNKAGTWLSTVVWVVVLFLALFVPLQWGAPSGPVRVMTYTVQIIPNVSGEVTEVAVAPNVPVKQGDELFRIDSTSFQASVDATRAQLSFQKLRLDQFKQLALQDAGTRFRVEETQAQVTRLEAELRTAEWNLEQTVVRAPSDGYATYLALRRGQRVTNFPLQPAMTFIDTSSVLVGAQIDQIYLRYLEIGQPVEIAFKTQPGRLYTGTVGAVIQVASQGQALISGTVPPPSQVQPEPFFVRIELDDQAMATDLPPGTVGTAAIYTEQMQVAHVIRRVMIRMESILNFVVPWL